MVENEDIKKIMRWKQLIANPMRARILALFRRRGVLTTAQIRLILFDMGIKGRSSKSGKVSPISYAAIHDHVELLENSGLIKRLELASLTSEIKLDLPKRIRFGTIGRSKVVPFELTRDGKAFWDELNGVPLGNAN